jgi:hypothetical protein
MRAIATSRFSTIPAQRPDAGPDGDQRLFNEYCITCRVTTAHRHVRD